MKGLYQLCQKPWAVILLISGLVILCACIGMPKEQSEATQTEERIAQVLSTIKGVGKVEVALYYQTTKTSLYDQNTQIPSGAIVVAQGADEVSVKLELIRAMQTLLSLPQSAVDVFAMEDHAL